MGMKSFLALGISAFIIATAGSDVLVQVSIANRSLASAVQDHFYWASVQFVGTLMLLAPFLALAVIGWWVEDQTRTRRGLLLFSVPTIYLIYDYFEGYRSALDAEMDKRWTAATLSIGLLPFAAIPVLLIAWLIGFFLVRQKRRQNDAG